MIEKNLAIGGVGTLALTTTIGVGVVYSRGSGMPACTLFMLEKEGDYKGKIGEFLGWYLTGTYGVEDENTKIKDNRDWWEWSYSRWQSDLESGRVLSADFQDSEEIKVGYLGKDEGEGKALNRFCEGIYKREYRDINDAYLDEDSEEHFLKIDLLNYCSPLGHGPKTIKDTGETTYEDNSSSYASSESGRANFVSVTDPDNDLFWELRTDEFFGNDDLEGNTAKSEDFRTFYDSKDRSNKGGLKDVCGRNYLLDKAKDNNKDELDYDIQRFCTLLVF